MLSKKAIKDLSLEQQRLLLEALKDWNEWATNGAADNHQASPAGFRYCRASGLCSAVASYWGHDPRKRSSAVVALGTLFVPYSNFSFPFGEDSYVKLHNESRQYTGTRRLRWLAKIIPELEHGIARISERLAGVGSGKQ